MSILLQSYLSRKIDPARYLIAMDHVPQKDGGFADEPYYKITGLLREATGNAKLALSDRDGRYLTAGLSLAPATKNGLLSMTGKPVNLCEAKSGVCESICLDDTGHARVSRNVGRARIAKSRLWIRDPEAFRIMLVREVVAFARRAARLGKIPVIRLNVFSDVRWERDFPELFDLFPQCRFYDYTKIKARIGNVPSNYHLTFSRSEINREVSLRMLERGVNVAVVFEDHSFPATWHGFDVIDSTISDLRILDPRGERGTVIALAEKDTELHGPKYAGKRNAAIVTAGFVLPTITSNVWAQALVTACSAQLFRRGMNGMPGDGPVAPVRPLISSNPTRRFARTAQDSPGQPRTALQSPGQPRRAQDSPGEPRTAPELRTPRRPQPSHSLAIRAGAAS
jgi:hypothetical protein